MDIFTEIKEALRLKVLEAYTKAELLAEINKRSHTQTMAIDEATKQRAFEIADRSAHQKEQEAEQERIAEEARKTDTAYAQELYNELEAQGYPKDVIAQTLIKMGIDYGIVDFLTLEPLETPGGQVHNRTQDTPSQDPRSMTEVGVGGQHQLIMPDSPPAEEAPPPSEDAPVNDPPPTQAADPDADA